MLQTFTIDGTGRQVDASASFFRYESGNASGGDLSIRVYVDGADLGAYLPGDAVRLPVAGKRWTFTPASSALVATIRLGVATVESARLVGTVNVVDESRTKTMNGSQFAGLGRRIAAASKVGLCGVLAGALPVSIKRLAFNTQGASGLCTLLYGTGAPLDTPTSLPIYNKRLGGSNALATRVSGLAATINPTTGEVPGVQNLMSVYVAQNVQQELPLTTPIVIPAGFGLYITSPVINQDIAMIFDCEEVA